MHPPLVGCSGLIRRRALQTRASPSTRVPHSNDLDGTGGSLDHAVRHLIAQAIEEDSAYADQFGVSCPATDVRLRGDQLERLIDLLGQRGRSLLTVRAPPVGGLFNLLGRLPSEADWKVLTHTRVRSARKTSSAEMVSPRSPSAIDARSSASAVASSSKVSSPSRERTVTTAPSGNGSPSTMIFPATTLPEVMTISEILTRM